MFNLGGGEIAIILIVALLVLGPKQLPEIGKQIGKMMRDFRNMSGDVTRALDLDGHNDYDYAANRHNAPDYGYNHPVIESADHAAEGFAYSAPVAGTTIAAIDDRPSNVAGDAAIADTETHHGARVYDAPVAHNDLTHKPGEQETSAYSI